MALIVHWFEGFQGPPDVHGWMLLGRLRGSRTVASSRTVRTESGILDLPDREIRVFRKTYFYGGLGAKVRGMFRTTFLAKSRPEREACALLRLRSLGLAPPPVALAEERRLGFLEKGILVTLAVPGGVDLSDLEACPGLPAAAGRAAGRMHAAGLGRLALAPRNLVVAPRTGSGWEVLKVDSGAMAEVPRGGPEQAKDLAELLAGLEERWGTADLDALREAYVAEAGGIPADLEAALPAARAALSRRAPRD